jgi:type I restriction enzyme S subunit
MSSEWNTVPLGDVASFKTGKLDSNAAEQGGKYPFFTCSPNTLAINSFAFDAEAVILAGNNANGVFSCKHYSGKFNAYQRTYVIEPLSKSIASCRYLFFVISHQVNHLKELSVGSATKFLTKTILNNLPVALPRLEEQERIAELLGALDDRITLLRETNATLEAIAQALFKSWFVDFDPVRAKQEGRAPEGMSDATAALFPDSFEESELDLVPKGWRYSTVGESFILTMGQSPPGDTYNETRDGLPFYQGRTDFGFRFPSQRVYCTAPTRIAEPGDTLVSVRAPVGDVNMALEKCCLGRGVAGLRHIRGCNSFAFYTLKGLRARFDLFDSEGTVFGSINKKDFRGLPVLSPSDDVLFAFDDIATPIDRRVIENEEQIRTLATLRDTLLPRLISGQLRLPEAVALIEEATA